jgi:putative transposase
MLTRRMTYRLYPKSTAAAKLHDARRLHWSLYNAAIANRRTQYERFGKSVSYYDQQNSLPEFKQVWTEYKELGSHTLQATLKRVDLAYQSFFQGLRGKPKFKALRRYSGWTYPDSAGWKAHTTGDNGYLELRDLGLQMQMRGQARTWGTPTTCTIVYRQGQWYASITVKCEPKRETGTGSVGLDFGCLAAVALSDGTKLDNPRFLAKTQSKIRQVSKQKRRKRAPNVKRKIKASKRWKKAAQKVAKLQRKAAHQRQDWAHQVAAEIVSGHSLVATEKLNIKGMTRKATPGGKRKSQKAGLNRSILDVGWGLLRGMIEYKLAECGGVFVEVPTQKVKPSQTCPNCAHQEPKTLAQREHRCAKCGYTDDRDVAAAKVCLSWALGTSVLNRREESSTVSPTVRHCGGFRQLSSMKRRKPRSS